jgi:hypothetical protein
MTEEQTDDIGARELALAVVAETFAAHTGALYADALVCDCGEWSVPAGDDAVVLHGLWLDHGEHRAAAVLAALREAGWAPPPSHQRAELDIPAIEARVVAYERAVDDRASATAVAAAVALAGDVAPLLAELE